MYFQLEIDYYSNEANKNKYKNFQLIASTRNNLKIADKQIVQGIVLATTTCHTLLLDFKVLCCLGLLLLESIFFKCKLCLFEQDICRSTFVSIRYMQIKTNTLVHNACPQVYPLLSTKM